MPVLCNWNLSRLPASGQVEDLDAQIAAQSYDSKHDRCTCIFLLLKDQCRHERLSPLMLTDMSCNSQASFIEKTTILC